MQPSLIVLILRILIALLLVVFMGLLIRLLRRDLSAEHESEIIPPAHLFIAEGPDTGRIFPLGESNLIGRGDSCTIQLNEPTISATHARLTYAGKQWILEDLGSRNGTRVNDIPVEEPMPIIFGDHIHFGSVMAVLTSRIDPPTLPVQPDYPAS